MQSFLMLATLVLLVVSSSSQAKTSGLSTPPCIHAVNQCASDENRNATGITSGGITSGSSTGIARGAGFLRKIDKRVVQQFENAWRDSIDGESNKEGVVLMFRMADGSYKGMSQGFSNEFRKFTFKWNPAALAIVHTHPNSCDPKPSEQDRRVADQYGVPNFTISVHGMYVYDPATKKTTKVMNGLDWLDLSKLTQEMSRVLESSLQVDP
jgi:hypothetical protein